MSKKNNRGLKYDFTLLSILLIPIGVAINFVGSQIVLLLKLPVYLDMIGTAVTTIIAGPWVGIATGIVSNLVKGITNPVDIAFTGNQIVAVIVISIFSIRGQLTKLWKVIIIGIVLAFFTSLAGAPVQVLVFGGVSGNSSDALVGAFLASGQEVWTSVLSTKFINESVDKVLILVISFFIVRNVSDRYLSKFNYTKPFMNKR